MIFIVFHVGRTIVVPDKPKAYGRKPVLGFVFCLQNEHGYKLYPGWQNGATNKLQYGFGFSFVDIFEKTVYAISGCILLRCRVLRKKGVLFYAVDNNMPITVFVVEASQTHIKEADTLVDNIIASIRS